MLMFTGIITHIGELKNIYDTTFTFTAPRSLCIKLTKGTSISVNGACLTVVNKPTTTSFVINIMPETRKKTMFPILAVGDFVNLELPASPKSLLSGHIVQGHVDGVGKIKKIEKDGNSRLATIQVDPYLSRYIVTKGSIAVNGISLTVIDTSNASFTVGIIPYTWRHTMFRNARVGDKVNIETDIIGKYVYKYIHG